DPAVQRGIAQTQVRERDIVVDAVEADRLAQRRAHERTTVQRAMATVAREIGDLVADPILEAPVQLETIVEAAKLCGFARLAAGDIVSARQAREPGAHQQAEIDPLENEMSCHAAP